MNRRKFILFTTLSPFLNAGNVDNAYNGFSTTRFSSKIKLKKEPTTIEEWYDTIDDDTTMDKAIIAEFGMINPSKEGIELFAPNLASNCSSVPITIKSILDAELVALFADSDSHGMHLIAKWIVPKNEIVNYFLKIKLEEKSGLKRIKVVIKDRNGMFYIGSKRTGVSICKGV